MFNLNFLTDNSAFQISDGAGQNEIYLIMSQVRLAVLEGETEGVVRDSNGNTIGYWSWKKGE